MIQHCDIGTAELAYRIFGDGPITVVIEGSINSCNAEWWDLCTKIENHTVLVYDRAGYGKSSVSSLPRTPENIVSELDQLLKKLGVAEEIILIGHSQGGLYAALFALKHPSKIGGLLLLDPLSFRDNEFKSLLTKQEYKASEVDKSQGLKIAKLITKLGLGWVVKGLLKKSPPFYYHEYPKESETYILDSLIQHTQYVTALAEYQLSHQEHNLTPFLEKDEQYDFPITLITHSKAKMCDEIEYFGNTTRTLAEKIDDIWQSLMDSMASFSRNSKKVTAENSSHYIHLSDEKLVLEELRSLTK